MNTIAIEDNLGITFCERQQIAIDRGQDCYVWDEDGNEYLDFTSGWGVTCLGHTHPCITQAIIQQAGKIIQNPNSGFTYSPVRAKLLATLRQVLPANLSKLYFANSGAEANDAALKLARKISGKSKVVSTVGSFHGRTFNTLSVSGGADNTSRYLPALKDTTFVPFGDYEALQHHVDGNTAALILEPIQGEGGVRIPEPDYLWRASLLCKQHKVLLIVDEIQTGFCRTGKFFALQHSAQVIEPDFLTMGKGIAGGFPFAAFAVSGAVATLLSKGDHGGTYCGNPLGCAVANSVVQYLIDNEVEQQVAIRGQLLLNGMNKLGQKHPSLIKSVRGLGLLCAIEFNEGVSVQAVTQKCLESGLLVTPTRNNVIRLIPSLLVQRAEVEKGLTLLDEALSAVVHPA